MRTQVREVFHKGSSSTVEWTDDLGYLRRVVVPSDQVVEEKDGTLYVDDIEDGYPAGVDWENLIHTRMGPKAIAETLRRNGIWTLEDYARNTATVTAAFNEACSTNLQQFKDAVLNFRDHKEEE
jgi:hypothetical protein